MFEAVSQFLVTHSWVPVVFAGSVAFFGAILTIITQRAINRRRATVDMMTTKAWDRDYTETLEHFYGAMRNQEELMVNFDLVRKHGDFQADPDSALTEEVKKKVETARKSLFRIRYILNDRELVAIGIREGIYDETIYRRQWYSTTLKEWHYASPFVARMRTDTPRAYIEFEALARRWETEGPWTPSFSTVRMFGRSFTIVRSR